MLGRLRANIVDDLSGLSDARLDEISADGHAFAQRPWFRLLDSLELNQIVGGQTTLRYVVVKLDHLPIAVCPVLRVRGEGAYFVYSMRQYYFEQWLDEAVRMAPQRREQLARLFRAVSIYRRVLEATGSRLDDSLLVCNPISYRGEVAIAPQTGVDRSLILSCLLDKLTALARQLHLPLRFLGIEGDGGRWHDALVRAGCTKSFLFHDNVVDLEPFDCYDDYLRSFSRTTRRAFQRDETRTAAAGIAFRYLESWAGLEQRLAQLYEQTYGKYGASHFRHPPGYWSAAEQLLGSQAELIVAERGDAIVGFCLLLHNERRGESWTYRIGRSEADGLGNVPYYFGLSFYGPIRRAIERGHRRIWLGPASYEAKAVRGASRVPLYNFHWSPRRLDRWLLHPYLKAFGDESRRQIEAPLESKNLACPVDRQVPASRSTN